MIIIISHGTKIYIVVVFVEVFVVFVVVNWPKKQHDDKICSLFIWPIEIRQLSRNVLNHVASSFVRLNEQILNKQEICLQTNHDNKNKNKDNNSNQQHD